MAHVLAANGLSGMLEPCSSPPSVLPAEWKQQAGFLPPQADKFGSRPDAQHSARHCLLAELTSDAKGETPMRLCSSPTGVSGMAAAGSRTLGFPGGRAKISGLVAEVSLHCMAHSQEAWYAASCSQQRQCFAHPAAGGLKNALGWRCCPADRAGVAVARCRASQRLRMHIFS